MDSISVADQCTGHIDASLRLALTSGIVQNGRAVLSNLAEDPMVIALPNRQQSRDCIDMYVISWPGSSTKVKRRLR